MLCFLKHKISMLNNECVMSYDSLYHFIAEKVKTGTRKMHGLIHVWNCLPHKNDNVIR